jgi:flagellar hook-associated protein 1 FlgK
MTLSVGLGIAQTGLSVTADQTAVVSRNIANASDPLATRKIANVVTGSGGGVRLASITRVFNDALFKNVLSSTSASTMQKAIVGSLDYLDQTISDPELDASPAALVTKFTSILQQYADTPSNTVMARAAVSAAADLVNGLNTASHTVQEVRKQADDEMAASVERLNTLLSQFETVNAAIVKGTRTGADVTDQLDARDRILASIAEEVGVTTVSRANNDMALYTDSGVTLFDVTARKVAFDRTAGFGGATTGNPVYVDGVPITGNVGGMPAASGRLVGLAAIRDDIAVTYQSQLDEIARGLIEAFAESDQSATPSLPDVPGLFTYSGAPAMPPGGTILPGLAASIRVNPSFDPLQGGDPNLLRDGGISGNPAYVYNAAGSAGFQDRLNGLVDGLLANRSFDPTARAGASATLAGFAAASVGWLQEERRSSGAEADYRATLLDRSSQALSKITGVNLDEEMTTLLELERSYQASSKIISTIDSMFDALLAAVR